MPTNTLKRVLLQYILLLYTILFNYILFPSTIYSFSHHSWDRTLLHQPYFASSSTGWGSKQVLDKKYPSLLKTSHGTINGPPFGCRSLSILTFWQVEFNRKQYPCYEMTEEHTPVSPWPLYSLKQLNLSQPEQSPTSTCEPEFSCHICMHNVLKSLLYNVYFYVSSKWNHWRANLIFKSVLKHLPSKKIRAKR